MWSRGFKTCRNDGIDPLYLDSLEAYPADFETEVGARQSTDVARSITVPGKGDSRGDRRRFKGTGHRDWSELPDVVRASPERWDELEGLRATIASFNAGADHGDDPVFDQCETPYERGIGDSDGDHPKPGPIEEPPFYAFELLPGGIGTKGGLVTMVESRVVDYDEEPIHGLYATSNSAAHLVGLGYAGEAATIGPNVGFRFIAGENAAADARGE